jgi:hypothetical protein
MSASVRRGIVISAAVGLSRPLPRDAQPRADIKKAISLEDMREHTAPAEVFPERWLRQQSNLVG